MSSTLRVPAGTYRILNTELDMNEEIMGCTAGTAMNLLLVQMNLELSAY